MTEHQCEFCDKITVEECEKIQNVKRCSSNCAYFIKEKYKAVDFGKPQVTFVGPGKVIPMVRDMFIPNFYECIECNIHNLEVSIMDLTKILVDVSFTLESRVTRSISSKEVYAIDEWKKESVAIEEGYFPILCVYTLADEPIKIIDSKCKILDRDEKFKRIGNILFTWMPYSKEEVQTISVAGMPEFPNTDFVQGIVCEGENFIGRNNCIYGHFCLDQKYQMRFECFYENHNKKNEVTHQMLGLFFPFPHVNYDTYSYYLNEGLEISPDSVIKMILPGKDKKEKLFLTPLQGNTQDLYMAKHKNIPLQQHGEKLSYDSYLMYLFHFKLKMNEEIAISDKWSELPILLGIYNTINKLHDGKYAPLKLVVNNNSSTLKHIRIVYSIEGISGTNTKEALLKANEENIFYLSPTLLEEKIELVSEMTKKLFRVQIFLKDGTCIWDNSKEIEVWPRETFLHKLKNDGDDWELDLDSYIACWVTPNSKQIEELIAKAGMTIGMSGIYASSEDKMLAEIKAIYDEISKDIRYISRSLSFVDSGKGQRVCLPSTTLGLKSGNCIDLSVLLASCLEALRYNVELALIKGHAFVVVRFSDKYFECIESTYMGKYSFSDALNRGREMYDDNFSPFGGSKKEGSILVRINHSRKCDILPME